MCSIGFIASYAMIVRVIYRGVFKGRHARNLPQSRFLEPPQGISDHIIIQYSAVKGTPIATVMCKVSCFNGVHNSNCNV